MRNYIVTAPDGKDYPVSAPDHLSDEDILAHANVHLAQGVTPPEYVQPQPVQIASNGIFTRGDAMTSSERAAYKQATGETISGDESQGQPAQQQQQQAQQASPSQTYSYEEGQRFTREHNEELAQKQAAAQQRKAQQQAEEARIRQQGGQAAANLRLKKLGY